MNNDKWHNIAGIHFQQEAMSLLNKLDSVNTVSITPNLVMGCLLMTIRVGAEKAHYVCGKLFESKGPADTRDLIAAMVMSVPGADCYILDIYEYYPEKAGRANLPKVITQIGSSFIHTGEAVVKKIGKGEWNYNYGVMPKVLEAIEKNSTYIALRGSGY